MRAWLLLVGLCALILTLPRAARANMAEAVSAGDLYGALVPKDSSNVRVERETLSFELDASLASAKVRAAYRMLGGAEVSSSQVAFVIVEGREGRGAKPTIEIDGQGVSFREVRADDVPANEREAMTRAWSTLDTRTKLAWLVFTLDMAPSQAREVVVTYTHRPTEDRAARVNSVFRYDYLLSPAKAWASFGPIDVSVRAPSDVTFSSNLPLAKQGDTYRAALAGLPLGELQFEVMSTRGLWFGMATSDGYWIIVITFIWGAAIGVGAATGRLFHEGSRLKRGLLRVIVGGGLTVGAALVTAVLLGGAMPSHALGFGYGGFFGVALLVLASWPIGIAASFLAARAREARPPQW